MIWGCLTAERLQKSERTVGALVRGWRGGGKVIVDEPPPDDNPFIVYGQLWITLRIIPPALASRRPFYHIDNGYWSPNPDQGRHYRVCYRGMSPIVLKEPNTRRADRMKAEMAPWRSSGSHILLAMPGRAFGVALGIDIGSWERMIRKRIRSHTDRPIVVREKDLKTPLDKDLRDCWALVTHSSNVATEAVRRGIPVFVEPTCPAAPVGNLNLADIEYPVTPDRTHWWRSLMCQQYTIDEMANGTAWSFLSRVSRQVDELEASR